VESESAQQSLLEPAVEATAADLFLSHFQKEKSSSGDAPQHQSLVENAAADLSCGQDAGKFDEQASTSQNRPLPEAPT
jgi:hypothetical protein